MRKPKNRDAAWEKLAAPTAADAYLSVLAVADDPRAGVAFRTAKFGQKCGGGVGPRRRTAARESVARAVPGRDDGCEDAGRRTSGRGKVTEPPSPTARARRMEWVPGAACQEPGVDGSPTASNSPGLVDAPPVEVKDVARGP